MQVDADARALEALYDHPRAADLATIARSVMTASAQLRRADARPGEVVRLAGEMGLARSDADTPFGNALDVLEHGPRDEIQRSLARALAARAVALFPPQGHEEEARAAADLLWLAAHTPYDATGLLDRCLGDKADGVWAAIADRVRRADAEPAGALGRGEALVGAVALAASSGRGAAHASALAAELSDPHLARVLDSSLAGEAVEPLVGELSPAPRGPVATALLAVSGILLVAQAVRLVGRFAFAYRRPATITFIDGARGGVRVHWRAELLGRTLRDRDVILPREGLARAARDVRYPSLALYVGLLSLAVGSYVGLAAFTDGVRSASPSLLLAGVAIVALGLALDFALSVVAPSARGRCRVVFVPRGGSALCVGGVEARRADALLNRLARGAS